MLEKRVTPYDNGTAGQQIVKLTNTYDRFNQLIMSITDDGKTVINTYNGEGLRIAKEVNGVAVKYLYEGDKIVAEYDASNNLKAQNIQGINLLMRVEKNASYYYMYNGHADVTALLNKQTGNIDATYYYDAFGTLLSQTGNVNNSYLYAGYQYDAETGLYYLNARMYDSTIARFIQEDTYRGNPNDLLSLNLYTYCANNPLIYHDPTGHKYEFSKFWNNLRRDIKKSSDSAKKSVNRNINSVKKSISNSSVGKITDKFIKDTKKTLAGGIKQVSGLKSLPSAIGSALKNTGKSIMQMPKVISKEVSSQLSGAWNFAIESSRKAAVVAIGGADFINSEYKQFAKTHLNEDGYLYKNAMNTTSKVSKGIIIASLISNVSPDLYKNISKGQSWQVTAMDFGLDLVKTATEVGVGTMMTAIGTTVGAAMGGNALVGAAVGFGAGVIGANYISQKIDIYGRNLINNIEKRNEW
ncbi:MAG: RHS repeat-associated core domain-containing protein [Oscillospiraceae bacterium]